jgi:hypothetical protein
MRLERVLSIGIIDALYRSPNIRRRTQEKLNTIGKGYWYFHIDRCSTVAHMMEFNNFCNDPIRDVDRYLEQRYNISNIDKWIYLPYETATRDMREAIESSDLSKIIFAATSLHTSDELINRTMKTRCLFSWRRECL